MTTKLARNIFSAAIAAGLVLEVGPVMAQAQEQAQAPRQLEEVVVTARKRQESILKVPVTMTALSGDTLSQYAISGVRGIADKVPGLNFGNGPLSSGVLVSLRGIGTSSNNPTIDQSVALVVDGVQFTQGLAYGAAMFDMANVQVLKGPQALFFGKAAPAGVIAVRTKDPTDEYEVILRGGYETEAKEKLGEFIASGPVTDTLGLRLSGQYSTMDGYMNNLAEPTSVAGGLGAAPVTHQNFPDKKSMLLRGTAVWRPTDNLKARLKLNYSSTDVEGTGGEPQLVSCPEGTGSFAGSVLFPLFLTGGQPITFIGGESCNLNNRQSFAYLNPAAFPGIYNDGVPFNESDMLFGSLELNYDLGDSLTLTSVTGYGGVHQKSMINGSLTTEVGTPFAIQGKLERNNFTQEVRLTSDFASPVNFMVGGFYQKGETDYLSVLPLNQTWAPILSLRINPVPPALGAQDHHVDAKTMSFFGQVLWQITTDVELGVGARWTDENRHHSIVNQLTGSGVNLANPKIGSRNWSPELTLTYTPTDSLTLYGNLKQAYKSGSFDVSGVLNPGDDSSFKDEKVTGGELGLKSRMFEDTLAVNIAGYYYTYKDLQVERNVFSPYTGTVSVRTTNAATAHVYGVDFDATYVPPVIEGLTLSAAVNWNHAEYQRFTTAPCWTGQTIGQGCNRDLINGAYSAQDLSGQPLLRAPKWMANVGINYEIPVFNDMTLRLGSNTSYSSKYSASIENRNDGYQNDYIKTSANVALSGANDRWTVEVIGNNLTNKLVYGKCNISGYGESLLFGTAPPVDGTGTATQGPGGQGENACFIDRGREVWLRLTVKIF